MMAGGTLIWEAPCGMIVVEPLDDDCGAFAHVISMESMYVPTLGRVHTIHTIHTLE